MGKVMSMISRKVNRFNVENRAHKLLEQDKPVPAPKFESNLKDMQRAMEVNPDFIEKESRKDVELDNRLKQVYVTSKDSYIDYGINNSIARDLPTSRNTPGDFEYGYKEPTRITIGKCSIRQSMKFIVDHQNDPIVWNAQKVAEEYKLKEATVEKILTYFKSFQLHISNMGAGSSDNILTQNKDTKQISEKGKDSST